MKKGELFLFGIIVLCLICCMGYSMLQSGPTVNGTALVRAQLPIRITNVKVSQTVGSASVPIAPTYTENTTTFNSTLSNTSSYIKYEVTISNKTSNCVGIDSISVVSDNNSTINHEISGMDLDKEYCVTESKLYITVKTNSNTSNNSEKLTLKYYLKEMKEYTITNLIKNGSYEDDWNNWSHYNVTIVDGGTHGSKCLRFGHNNLSDYTAMSTQSGLGSPLLNHKYYGSLMFKSPTVFNFGSAADDRFEWYYNDDPVRGKMILASKNISTNNEWERISSIKSITSDLYLSSTWIIRNFIRSASDYSYCDEVMLIDLTAAFGEGNEPTKSWCDSHIDWFEGEKVIYK